LPHFARNDKKDIAGRESQNRNQEAEARKYKLTGWQAIRLAVVLLLRSTCKAS
jgi:hypothetical protein